MFNSDKPISSKSNDALNRSSFSKQIAKAILAYKSTENFTISLCGPWGSGKTSVVNMIEEEINDASTQKNDDEKPVVIKFNPWNYSNNDQLLSQFFAVMNETLKSFNSSDAMKNIGEALEKYSKVLNLATLIPAVGPFLKILPDLFEGIGKNLTEIADQNSSISNQKEKIVELLSKEKRKFVIIIDDIDRLSNQQICMIFQLVNSIAGFPNMVYVLAFDKKIVCRALEEVQKCDGLEYLEKIIQVPFDIPVAKKTDVNNIFFEKLDSIVDKEFEESYWHDIFDKCVSPFIKTIRDVNRVINVFKFKYTELHTELNWIDLLAITVLEIEEPDIYNWIYNNKDHLTGTSFDYRISITNNKSKELFAKLLEEIKPKCNTNDSIVIESIQALFPIFAKHTNGHNYHEDNADKLRSSHKIASADKFDMYFYMSISDVKITDAEMMESINDMSQKDLRDYFLQLTKNSLLNEYIYNLRGMVSSIPEEKINMFIIELLRTQNYKENLKQNNSMHFSVAFECQACVDLICYHLNGYYPSDKNVLSNHIVELIPLVDEDILPNMLDLVYLLENSCGRFDKVSNGSIRLTDDELNEIDEQILLRLKSLPKNTDILNNIHFGYISKLWQNIDLISYKEFILEQLEKIDNIPRFIFLYSSIDDKYFFDCIKIDDSYQDYISKENAYSAICKLKNTVEFANLDLKFKKIAIAIYQLHNIKEDDYYEKLRVDKLESLIPEWEK